MDKISSAQASQVLRFASANMRKLAAENRTLQARVAGFEKEARCRKLATVMQEKGMNSELTFEEKVASLMSQSDSDIAITEKAVDLSASGDVKLASISDGPGMVPGQKGGKLHSFLLTREVEDDVQ